MDERVILKHGVLHIRRGFHDAKGTGKYYDLFILVPNGYVPLKPERAIADFDAAEKELEAERDSGTGSYAIMGFNHEVPAPSARRKALLLGYIFQAGPPPPYQTLTSKGLSALGVGERDAGPRVAVPHGAVYFNGDGRQGGNTDYLFVPATHLWHARNWNDASDLIDERVVGGNHRAILFSGWHEFTNTGIAVFHVDAVLPAALKQKKRSGK